jgi:hypothetical protein
MMKIACMVVGIALVSAEDESKNGRVKGVGTQVLTAEVNYNSTERKHCNQRAPSTPGHPPSTTASPPSPSSPQHFLFNLLKQTVSVS